GAVARGGPTERVALDPAALIAVGCADLVIAGIAPAFAEALPQLLGEVARRLLQLIERLGLRPDRLARLAALQGAGGVAHRPLGAAERVGNIAHALAKPAHHLAELVPQILLLASLLARLAGLARILFARLAALPH